MQLDHMLHCIMELLVCELSCLYEKYLCSLKSHCVSHLAFLLWGVSLWLTSCTLLLIFILILVPCIEYLAGSHLIPCLEENYRWQYSLFEGFTQSELTITAILGVEEHNFGVLIWRLKYCATLSVLQQEWRLDTFIHLVITQGDLHGKKMMVRIMI